MTTIRIYNGEITLDYAETQLSHFRDMDVALHNGTIKPRAIVGNGYSDTRLAAERYIAGQIARWDTLIQVMREN
jgi:hypothetical protein